MNFVDKSLQCSSCASTFALAPKNRTSLPLKGTSTSLSAAHHAAKQEKRNGMGMIAHGQA